MKSRTMTVNCLFVWRYYLFKSMIFISTLTRFLNAVDGSYDNNWMECDIHLDIWILCVIHQYSPMPLDEAIYSALIRLLWSIWEKLHESFWICAGVYTCMCVWTCTCLFYIHVCIHPGFFYTFAWLSLWKLITFLRLIWSNISGDGNSVLIR